MSPVEKAKVLGALGESMRRVLGDDNLFFTLIVDGSGHVSNCSNISRPAIPQLLREYADQMERKHGG